MNFKYWKDLFENKNFMDRLTGKMLSDLFSRVHEFADYPFTGWNVYQLYETLRGEVIDSIRAVIIEYFDKFTHQHSKDGNSRTIHYYDGWKTNKAFKIGKKVIMPMYTSKFDWIGSFYCPYKTREKLADLEKTFDYLAGTLTTSHAKLDELLTAAAREGITENIKLKHFSVTFYKAGTCHITFNDSEIVHKWNVFAGQHHKWLPPGYGEKPYQRMTPEERRTVDSFEGRESYEKTMRNPNRLFRIDPARFLPAPQPETAAAV